MSTTLVIPGLNGSGPGHWQHFWAEDRPDARIVNQKSFEHPEIGAWLETLERELLGLSDVYLVGHSLGCLLIASLAGREAARAIKGAILVAPCDLGRTENLHPGAIAFGDMPERPLPFPSITVGSLNDPYMGFDHLQSLTSAWGSDLIDIGCAGHINVASGFGRWERSYDLLAILQSRNSRRARTVAESLPHATSAMRWTFHPH